MKEDCKVTGTEQGRERKLIYGRAKRNVERKMKEIKELRSENVAMKAEFNW